MRTSTAYQLCVSILLAALINWQWRFSATDTVESTTYALEFRATPTVATHVQVYYDDGAGYAEDRSARVALPEINQLQTAQLPLPRGTYRSLRIDPFEGAGSLEIASIRIVDSAGRGVKTFSASDFRPKHHVLSLRPQGESGMSIVSVPGDADPQIETIVGDIEVPPVPIGEKVARLHLGRLGVIAVALFLILLALDCCAPANTALRRLADWGRSRPHSTLAAVAVLSVLASAYPVVFLGQSYVSPNGGTTLLYGGFPTLPGYASDRVLNTQGSDVGAIMWQHVPYAAIQHRALAGGEWPLWNRYTSGGTPLLGQGQSMFGDPLHWLPIAFKSAAWAWDLKYLVAKTLLALGLGLCVWRLTSTLSAASLVAAACPFIGFFIYRQNHPAIFSFCYSPWIVLGWITLAQSSARRQCAWGGALLFTANASTLTSGTVKEAYALLLALNFTGLALLVFNQDPSRERFRKLGWAISAVVLSAAATTPVWATFFRTLRTAYTTYDQSVAYQLQPSLLLAAFDELFYRPLTPHHFVYNPALNLLLAFGLLYYVGAGLRRKQAVFVLAATSLLPLALVYGVIPSTWIVRIPLLRNIWHIDNSFGCVLLVLWMILAGAGFAHFKEDIVRDSWKGPLLRVGVMLIAIIGLWAAYFQVVSKPALFALTYSPSRPTTIPNALWIYLLTLLSALALWTWGVRLFRHRTSVGIAGALVLCIIALLWRQGQHATSVGLGEVYTVKPAVRADFHAASPAISALRSMQKAYPARVVGMNGALFPGWSAIYGLESPGGVDALSNRYYAELVGQFPDWELPLPADATKLQRLQPLLNLLNVQSYLSAKENETRPPGTTRLAYDGLDMAIDVASEVWPRAFFTDRVAITTDVAELAALIKKEGERPFAAVERSEFRSHAALATLSADLTGRSVMPATAYRLRENGLEFSILAGGPGLAVAHETYWPGEVKATVNGKPATVIRTNHAFRGVEIPTSGLHRVRFEYVPAHFPLYKTIGAASLIIAITLFAWGLWSNPAPRPLA